MRPCVYGPRRVQRSHPMVRRLLCPCAWWPARRRCVRDVQFERCVWTGYVEQLEGAMLCLAFPSRFLCVHLGSRIFNSRAACRSLVQSHTQILLRCRVGSSIWALRPHRR
jgi:hypothetical protein